MMEETSVSLHNLFHFSKQMHSPKVEAYQLFFFLMNRIFFLLKDFGKAEL